MNKINKHYVGSAVPKSHDYEVCDVACRQLVSVEVVNRLHSLVERLEMLSERTYGKLGPIMMPNYPTEPLQETCKAQEYPEYFDTLRVFSNRIENAIQSIDNALSRVEF